MRKADTAASVARSRARKRLMSQEGWSELSEEGKDEAIQKAETAINMKRDEKKQLLRDKWSTRKRRFGEQAFVSSEDYSSSEEDRDYGEEAVRGVKGITVELNEKEKKTSEAIRDYMNKSQGGLSEILSEIELTGTYEEAPYSTDGGEDEDEDEDEDGDGWSEAEEDLGADEISSEEE